MLLDDVLDIPHTYKNIIFISSLTSKAYEFHFSRDVCDIYFGNKLVGMGYLIFGSYYGNNISNNIEPLNFVNTLLIENMMSVKNICFKHSILLYLRLNYYIS